MDFTNICAADIEESGDKAYAEGYHQAAKIFFTSISQWSKLATTLVHLEDYQSAVECARKANNIKVWKQVNAACVAKKEFRLAQICGLNLIVDAEELEGLVKQYENNGYFDELIAVLEQGLGLGKFLPFLMSRSFPLPLTLHYLMTFSALALCILILRHLQLHDSRHPMHLLESGSSRYISTNRVS